MDAAGQLAQLLDRDLELGRRRVGRGDRFVVRSVGRPEAGSEQSQRERQRDEPLLRAVVQVAFQSSPLRVRRFDDPGPRTPQLFLRSSLVREVADDRGHLVGPAGRDARLEVAPVAGQVEREEVGAQVAGSGVECGGATAVASASPAISSPRRLPIRSSDAAGGSPVPPAANVEIRRRLA